jgi:hypothetical protein
MLLLRRRLRPLSNSLTIQDTYHRVSSLARWFAL